VQQLMAHPNLTKIVARCTWGNVAHTGGAYTGANRVWAATGHVMRGLLWPNQTLVDDALARAWGTATAVTPQHDDGLQADASWHQHGPQV